MRVMAVNGVGMALAYASHVLFAKWLGVAQYGYYVYALAWLNVLTVLVQLGMNTSTVRITAELRGQDRHAAILGLSMFSTQVVIASGLVVMVIGGAALALTADLITTEQSLTLAIMLGLVVVLSLLYQRMALLQGFERVAQAQSFLEIVRPVVLISLVGLCVLAFDVEAHVAMLANLAATALALMVAAVAVGKFLNAGPQGRVMREFEARAWLAVSLPYLVIGLLTAVITQSDVLMLGTLMGGVAAGLYTPAIKLAQLVLFPMMAIRSRAAPLMARLYAEDDMDELQHQMNITTVTSALTGFVLVAGLIWQRETLLGLFGPDFIQSAPVVVILALAMGVYAVTGGIEVFLIFGPFERVTVLIYALVVALNITLNLILIPRMGILGAAYATAATVVVRGLISTYVVWRRTGILPWTPLRVEVPS
ncbi:oligosaccharide flippase family protein [Pseudomonadota bacterium]